MATLLGIESSCDDTAASVLTDGGVRSNVISSQGIHDEYGGVVPELASRAHQRLIVPVVRQALREGGVTREKLDGVAVTTGPGLAGALLVGLSFAKAFALGRELPILGVNHLEGHIYSVFLDEPVPSFPYLCLIVSGGHTELVEVRGHGDYRLMGRTRDDAAGEAFDKVATLFDLEYPGGPVIDRLAREGDPEFESFPRSDPEGYDFSFSGLKTAVLYYLKDRSEAERAELLETHRPDLCASFQAAVVDVLEDALARALRETGIRDLAVVGGVSANRLLRSRARSVAEDHGARLHLPDTVYCMDNAAMIARAGLERFRAGRFDTQLLTVDPNLPLPTAS